MFPGKCCKCCKLAKTKSSLYNLYRYLNMSCSYIMYREGEIWCIQHSSSKYLRIFRHPHIRFIQNPSPNIFPIQKPNKPNSSGAILSEVVKVQSLGHCRTPPYVKTLQGFFNGLKRGGNRKTTMKIEHSTKRLHPKMKRGGSGVQRPNWICCHVEKQMISWIAPPFN